MTSSFAHSIVAMQSKINHEIKIIIIVKILKNLTKGDCKCTQALFNLVISCSFEKKSKPVYN